MSLTDDPGLEAVLAAHGIGPDALLGGGGEASVYAIDENRVLRVLRPGGDAAQLRRNHRLVRDLATTSLPFRLPEILEIGEVGDRAYAVERRLPGRSLMDVLGTAEGRARDRLVEAHLAAAWALGELGGGWPYFGDLVAEPPVRAETWRGYLTLKAGQSLATAGSPLDRIDPGSLASDLPEPTRSTLVHLDAFAGNMMSDGTVITAVLDIGYACVAGDRRMGPLGAAVYLDAPGITPSSTPRDREVARSWLRAAGLVELLEPARRWLAAYWSFARDDAAVQEWCRAVLR